MKPIDPAAARRVLARAPNWLGDAIMCIPALKALARALEPVELRVLAVGGLGEIFIRYPFVSRTLKFNKEDSNAVHRLLAKETYDALWLFTNSFRSAYDGLRTGCKIRVGYGGNMRDSLLTHPVPKTPNVHMIDYYLNLVSPFSGTVFSQSIDFPLLPREEEFAAGMEDLEYGAVGIPLGAKYGPAKVWPHDNVKQLITLLAGTQRRIVLFGTPAEAEQAADLEGAGKGLVVNLVGGTSIGEMAAVMKRCDWVVANDSGPLHLAGAVGVKTIAIFGPTDYNRTAPLSDNVRIVSKDVKCAPCMKRQCPAGHHQCMNDINAEEIYDIIEGPARI
ncbi:MAG: lipopolysaccharide heptosyltransferase II [Nitrospinae bacterium]|nr:lipopolysaccharide heptosyltransferase II [Nitrospinota bacterium]